MTSFETPKGTRLPILNLKGKDYLQVAHRLVWFREEHPNWKIETEYVSVDSQGALAKAVIKDDGGSIMATAHKREDKQHFPDYAEKAETGAIGRALALCGFGTQFCADELNEGERLADAPISRPWVEQPSAEETAKARVHLGYTFPFGSYKMRTPKYVLENKGPETLKNIVSLIEEKLAQNETYKGVTVEQMQEAVSEIEKTIAAFENGETK
jgi:hypothetical protein